MSVIELFAIDTKNTIGNKLLGKKIARITFEFYRMATLHSILMYTGCSMFV